ncbi:MAG: hypothetical protein NXI08_11125 [bacterium]|nr:hypothetical protein [bacterium]
MDTVGLQLLLLVFALFLFTLVWNLAWENFIIDRFRSNLFDLRDSLFELANESELDTKSTIYVNLRDRLNLIIRYADELSLLSIIKTFVIVNSISDFRTPKGVNHDLEKAKDLGFKYSDEVDEKLNSIEIGLNFEMVSAIVLRNPVLIICVLFVAIYLTIKQVSIDKIKIRDKMKRSPIVSERGTQLQKIFIKEEELNKSTALNMA